MTRHAPALIWGGLLSLGLSAPLAAAVTAGQVGATDTPAPAQARPAEAPAAPAPAPPPGAAATSEPAAPAAAPTPAQVLEEVLVQTTEPRFVAPTRRDRIGRIWAPVLIDGKGPYRMVLDTGATSSAVAARAAQSLGNEPVTRTVVTGFTGSAVVPTIHVGRMEVGELLMGASDLPVLPDVFGGAQGVLGIEGLHNKRIYADFTRDRLEITLSRGERAHLGFVVVPLRVVNGLLIADVHVGNVRTQAIVDTGAQGTVGNLALQHALMRSAPHDSKREDIIGVTLDVQSGDYIPSPDIDFAPTQLKVRGAHITFGDMYLFQHWKLTDRPTLTLGMDMLGSFDVLVIDYSRHELQVRPREAPDEPARVRY